jgi:hypothetical protein
MFFAIYFLYAFAQAILMARYIDSDKTSPVANVIVYTLLAPFVSIFLVFTAFNFGIRWLVTYKKP